MKDNTRESSSHLRGLATFCMVIGIAGFILAIIGIVWAVLSTQDSIYHAYTGFFIAKCVGGAFAFLFVSFICYVQLSAYATLIENSDRTEVVDAINDLTETISLMIPAGPKQVICAPSDVPNSDCEESE